MEGLSVEHLHGILETLLFEFLSSGRVQLIKEYLHNGIFVQILHDLECLDPMKQENTLTEAHYLALKTEFENFDTESEFNDEFNSFHAVPDKKLKKSPMKKLKTLTLTKSTKTKAKPKVSKPKCNAKEKLAQVENNLEPDDTDIQNGPGDFEFTDTAASHPMPLKPPDDPDEVRSADVFKCPKCPSHFFTHKAFQRHMNATHKQLAKPSKKVECPLCAKKFISKRNMEHHRLSTHKEGVGVFCSQCPFTCMTINQLKRHTLRQHTKKTIKCPKCDFTCAYVYSLVKHDRNVHTEKLEKNFPCPKCNRSYYRLDLMKRHLYRTHDKARTFQCSLCEKAFTERKFLTNHENGVHKGFRFSCSQCDSQFTQQYDLTRHIAKKHSSNS